MIAPPRAAQEPQLDPIQQRVRLINQYIQKADRCRELNEIGLANHWNREARQLIEELRFIHPALPAMIFGGTTK